MMPFKEIPSPSSLFATYASMTASVLLVRTLANDLIPIPLRNYAISTFRHLFSSPSQEITVIIEELNGIVPNQIYEASEVYLSTKLSPNTQRIKITKTPNEKNVTVHLDKNEKIVDFFQGAELKWKYIVAEPDKNNPYRGPPPRFERRLFELTFHRKHKDLVMGSYLPFLLEKANDISEDQRVLKMFTLAESQQYGCTNWDSVNLEHPSTFETLAMEPDLKNNVIQDLNRFAKRKEFYRRVGRAWKRGYLLYGPPGTGKSSLVAAMANYLKFDVYDLQLANVKSDSDLRRLLLNTGNRSILVIEDIDCIVDLPDRRDGDACKQSNAQAPIRAAWKEKEEKARAEGHGMLTLSGLLNFIDGLWSSCGDERIIVLTTNHKERLDPALLRPGRMDMHIHMSYCTNDGFRLLASNYLGITGQHRLYKEIEGLIESARITPAQVAEELLKSESADVALEGFLKTLRNKLINSYEIEEDEVGTAQKTKRQKTEENNKSVIRSTIKGQKAIGKS